MKDRKGEGDEPTPSLYGQGNRRGAVYSLQGSKQTTQAKSVTKIFHCQSVSAKQGRALFEGALISASSLGTSVLPWLEHMPLS